MYRYRVNWYSDFEEKDQVEYGFVAAASYGEAATRVEAFYTGATTFIYDLKLWAVEPILTDREALSEIDSAQ